MPLYKPLGYNRSHKINQLCLTNQSCHVKCCIFTRMDKYSLWNLVCGYLFILKMHYFPSLWWGGSRAFHIQLGWIIVQVYNPNQGQIMSPTLWYNIVQRELDLLDIPLLHWSTILMIPYQSILGRRTWQVLWMPWWYTRAPESGRKKPKLLRTLAHGVEFLGTHWSAK